MRRRLLSPRKLLASWQANCYNAGMSKKKLSAQLQDAIERSGMTRYQIAKGSGVTEGQLSRFVNQGSRFTLKTVDKLAEFLDLQLTVRKRRKR